jgi:K+-transporting ATPase ATPase C chain
MKSWLPSLRILIVLSVLTGVIYPALVTLVAQVCFHARAEGSLIRVGGIPVGSRLVGQSFTRPDYFWGRISATSPWPYNPASSSGSNLGPLNPALAAAIRQRIRALKEAGFTPAVPVPVDLVTSSASGLDPDISLAAAAYQTPRVAHARRLRLEQVEALVARNRRMSILGLVGEPVVSVLQLNLDLDRLGRP